ncbi:bifunctional folylpolyglutamate synthase/dihydrofolate synthase [Tepidibacillus fermentans]|uniref:Dihydrofolate synthase/folylpolyglutamate synthase n=1 Tax=Tepidibacillus fermentans TaxID=1281767 RepID=A0A4V2URW8_9BACI|nr:folylpolyglutamate synthase/dihydrofolate synthase family protein [Tepidibacillus fermentans]TCS79042.1 dihydrofolate synthase/folylpolyglutamate synthase [Tepidibacillus fermentans]
MGDIQVKTKEEVINWIHGREKLGIKPGLERMEWMLERVGHPERHLKFVHVAGTNGKGSTVSFTSQVLRRNGYTVGTFTSPYLIDFTNRIQVNGEDISEEDLVEIVNQLIPLAKELEQTELGGPSEFEVVTMIAILYFGKISKPDIIIWETGLGGRLDSTNVVYPLVSVITNIGYDHMEYLGDDLKSIAWEKAGIIKSGVPVVSGVEQDEAKAVIHEVAKAKRATIYQFGEQFSVVKNKIDYSGSNFDFKDVFLTMPNIEISLIGAHQVKNAAVALMTLEVLRQFYAFQIEEDSVYSGMKYTNWPGRLEKILEEPLVILDGAHNPDGATSLAEAIQLFEYKRLILVTGILKDKAIQGFYQPLVPLADTLIITEPEFPRAAKAEEVAEIVHSIGGAKKVLVNANWKEAVNTAIREAGKEDLVIITGSLYMISDVRKYIFEYYKKS